MASNTDDFCLFLQPCSLPRVPVFFNCVTATDPRLQAYNRACALEALGAWPATRGWQQPLFAPEVAGRVLGRFLCELPEEGVDIVARDINSCVRESDVETHGSLASLASLYMDNVLQPFLQYPDKIASPGDDEDDDDEDKPPKMDPPDKALGRDDNRCMITRLLDYEKGKQDLSLDTTFSLATTFTKACYIIPHEMVSAAGKSSVVRAIFENPGRLDKIPADRERNNGLQNILTLDLSAHGHFTTLALWFTPVEVRTLRPTRLVETPS
ncbi:hypothetical protein FA95DRAFT_1606038 [Auriscalpium vulgare]|uniref:Uncharacterized protein n=1 Tax=Auriscalpium vulgare TaxID=40419 RepID=A0ACB8RV79_9AGAM|nr:hypothetical protein FA95DRAFT_1606038 [Auriscalpium vulgare]